MSDRSELEIGAIVPVNAGDQTSPAPAQPAESSTACAATVPPLSLAPSDATPERPERGPNGQYLVGNPGHRTHGLYARVSDALIEARQDFERQQLTDDGGDVPVRRASRMRYRARLHVAIEALADAIETHGLFDRRGRLRQVWLQRLDSLIGTAARLDASLGDERRARDITTLSAAEYAALTQGRSDGRE